MADIKKGGDFNKMLLASLSPSVITLSTYWSSIQRLIAFHTIVLIVIIKERKYRKGEWC
ncbi:SsrA-binding protein [Bacillus sp. SG-1]|nr:SsrA-binding protein [Bacillus sp. SG-1]